MSLLGSLLGLGIRGAAQQFVGDREVSILQVQQSGLVRFAKAKGKTAYSNDDFPITYFESPKDLKKKEIMYEMVKKLLNQETADILSEADTYFIVANSFTGKATNGLIATEKGIIYNYLSSRFVPIEEIKYFEADENGCVEGVKQNGDRLSFLVMTTGKIKKESARFVKLFNVVYGK